MLAICRMLKYNLIELVSLRRKNMGEDFASYILGEKDLASKMMIAYYLSTKTGIYLDK